jgi:hypothetical protein
MLVKIVAKFQDGTLMKGQTSDFLPNKKSFHISTANGQVININIEQLKAVFFVKDFTGNKQYKDDYKDVVPGGGKKIRVKFTDGELMVGYTQGYAPNRPGFFLVPADQRSNNQRIFVVSSAVEKIEFL